MKPLILCVTTFQYSQLQGCVINNVYVRCYDECTCETAYRLIRRAKKVLERKTFERAFVSDHINVIYFPITFCKFKCKIFFYFYGILTRVYLTNWTEKNVDIMFLIIVFCPVIVLLFLLMLLSSFYEMKSIFK